MNKISFDSTEAEGVGGWRKQLLGGTVKVSPQMGVRGKWLRRRSRRVKESEWSKTRSKNDHSTKEWRGIHSRVWRFPFFSPKGYTMNGGWEGNNQHMLSTPSFASFHLFHTETLPISRTSIMTSFWENFQSCLRFLITLTTKNLLIDPLLVDW